MLKKVPSSMNNVSSDYSDNSQSTFTSMPWYINDIEYLKYHIDGSVQDSTIPVIVLFVVFVVA